MNRLLVVHMERAPKTGPVRDFLNWWAASGPFSIVVTSGARTDADQEADYAKGRMKLPDGTWVVSNKAAVVTHALRAADSAHGHVDAAADCHPVREWYLSGLPRLVYTGDEADVATRAEAIRRLDEYDRLAELHGLETGRHYPGLCDRPHVCDPKWKSLPLNPGVTP